MHGNTTTVETSAGKLKTRDFDSILSELKTCMAVHHKMGSKLGGLHFELTGENVTECTGGPEALVSNDLPHRYTTYCDPRLNYAQSMEIAFLLANHLSSVYRERCPWLTRGASPPPQRSFRVVAPKKEGPPTKKPKPDPTNGTPTKVAK
eukprot:NODE_4719_length_750_cov_20.569823_g4559_i0.p2 GENE.NODE_4719_length_750_cov_20.569823_g4559_i0~~NODE_4719_length_750_cov_20.569823_g4559_i0.p2  ORF type:complete len:149 (-),score=36.43 NODE_4719_length_750_cov_20.569823_g4559_i0:106-552(-)